MHGLTLIHNQRDPIIQTAATPSQTEEGGNTRKHWHENERYEQIWKHLADVIDQRRVRLRSRSKHVPHYSCGSCRASKFLRRRRTMRGKLHGLLMRTERSSSRAWFICERDDRVGLGDEASNQLAATLIGFDVSREICDVASTILTLTHCGFFSPAATCLVIFHFSLLPLYDSMDLRCFSLNFPPLLVIINLAFKSIVEFENWSVPDGSKWSVLEPAESRVS